MLYGNFIKIKENKNYVYCLINEYRMLYDEFDIEKFFSVFLLLFFFYL